MLAAADANFKKYDVNVKLLDMDAHHMTFDDDTFDLVVSRNVTHAIRDHGRVYSEWRRVLKPGGVLLIFDANWHLAWNDPEMIKETKRRYRECIEKFGSDFSGNTTYDDEEFSKTHSDLKDHILAGIQRPDFDFGVLKAVGFDEITVDRDITENLWDDKEKLLFGNTPMFMIKAIKGADHVVEICTGGCCTRGGGPEVMKAIKDKLGMD